MHIDTSINTSYLARNIFKLYKQTTHDPSSFIFNGNESVSFFQALRLSQDNVPNILFSRSLNHYIIDYFGPVIEY